MPVGVAVAVAAWCWVVSGFRTFTHPAEVATGIPIVAVAIGIVVSRQGRTSRRVERQPQRWLLAWAALLVILVVWELYELRDLPRYDHPTISSIVDSLFRRSRLVKAATIAGWLALGWRLVHPALPAGPQSEPAP